LDFSPGGGDRTDGAHGDQADEESVLDAAGGESVTQTIKKAAHGIARSLRT